MSHSASRSTSWIVSAHSETIFIIAVSVFVALLSSGCASTGGGAADSVGGPSVLTAGRTVGQLSVSTAEGLTSEVVEIAGQFSVAKDLETAIRRVAMGGSFSDRGSLSVDVEIIKMRVRTTASAIMWGMMAGVDVIDVRVVISNNGEVIKDFETGVSTALGGFVYGARGKRITRMIDALAKRITAGI